MFSGGVIITRLIQNTRNGKIKWRLVGDKYLTEIKISGDKRINISLELSNKFYNVYTKTVVIEYDDNGDKEILRRFHSTKYSSINSLVNAAVLQVFRD